MRRVLDGTCSGSPPAPAGVERSWPRSTASASPRKLAGIAESSPASSRPTRPRGSGHFNAPLEAGAFTNALRWTAAAAGSWHLMHEDLRGLPARGRDEPGRRDRRVTGEGSAPASVVRSSTATGGRPSGSPTARPCPRSRSCSAPAEHPRRPRRLPTLNEAKRAASRRRGHGVAGRQGA
ncbi:hypothetical protein HBB16_15450 [Pseudonocardia sp. MCCB 268]|nr:hypothetical protein [Pseudonocardia cytotoxica]